MIDKPDIIIAPAAVQIAEQLVQRLVAFCEHIKKQQSMISIALSGGNTPKLLFQIIASQYATRLPWERIHIFWCDERCVPPDHPDSNYGMTKKYLLDHIDIHDINVHRIIGESNPDDESLRYSKEILNVVAVRDSVPAFDWMLLGIGEDGHTASIFPDQITIFNSGRFCAITKHPVTDQKRITLTGSIINNSSWITFLVTGANKSVAVSDILNRKEKKLTYPAAMVNPVKGKLEWYLDSEAAKRI